LGEAADVMPQDADGITVETELDHDWAVLADLPSPRPN